MLEHYYVGSHYHMQIAIINVENVNLFLQEHAQSAKRTQQLDGNYDKAMNIQEETVLIKTEVSCKMLENRVKNAEHNMLMGRNTMWIGVYY